MIKTDGRRGWTRSRNRRRTIHSGRCESSSPRYCVSLADGQLEDALNPPAQGDEGPSQLAVLSVVNYYLGRVDVVSLKVPCVSFWLMHRL